MTYRQRLARAVKVLLAARNMSHKKLAANLNVSRSKLSRALSGKAGWMPTELDLAAALRVEESALWYLTTAPKTTLQAEILARAIRAGWDDADDEDAP